MIGGTVNYLRRRWGRLPRLWQNLTVGVLIALSLPLLRQTDWVKSGQDLAMDTMIQLNASLDRMTAKAKTGAAQEFTFLEIDEKTYRSWNEPYHIPRDKLKKLIKFALDGSARAVIVDVNLNNPGIDKAADNSLLSYLAALPPFQQRQLILFRLANPILDQRDPPPFPTFRATLVDTTEASKINWAHPAFQVDTSDRIVRRWTMFQRGCYKGKPVILPSVQLQTMLMLKSAKDGKLNKLYHEQMQALTPKTCAAFPALFAKEEKQSGSIREVYRLDLTSKGLTERILYTMPWRHKAGYSSADLVTIPAHAVTEASTPPSYDAVRDRIVLIGASYQASHDLHNTPIGKMPGALVLLNATKSLLVLGQIKPPSAWVVWPSVLLLIFTLSLLFSFVSKLTASILITMAVVVVLMPVSYFLFRYGIWFDFAAPLLGIQLHQIVAEFNRRP